MHNYICFDVETGGLSSKENPITEIALIAYNNVDFKELFRWESFVQPYHDLKYDPKAMQITGITEKQLASGITFKEVVDILILVSKKFTIKKGRWVVKPIFVGHNIAEFDVGFLEYIFDACEKNLWDYFDRYMEDTLKMARNKWEGEYNKFNLTSCCGYAGIEIIDAHRALNDVEPNMKLHRYLVESLRNKNVKFVASAEETSTFRETFQI